ncbi:MAG TPA: ABC transporter permease [Mycobacteriales bacterium]|nr:ABC transporter permease [Mycobacteriales bacterium]
MTGLRRFAAERLAALVAVLVALTAIVFLLERQVPANPVRALLGTSASSASVAAKKHQLYLDRGLGTQFWHFLVGAVQGNLGMSLHTRRPVMSDIRSFLPATLELAFTAAVIAGVIGVAVGLLTARSRGRATRLGLLAAASIPQFLLGLILLLLFYSKLQWLPGQGRLSSGVTAPSGPTGMYTVDSLLHGELSTFGNALWHLLLPAVTLAIVPSVAIARTLRSSLQTTLRADYIRTARAKALPERTVLLRHALRNSAQAPLTMAGLQVGLLLSGVVVVEDIFAFPGIGLYMVRSIQTFDLPAVAGVSLVLGAMYVVINALVDLAQAWTDPRVRVR